LDLTLPSFAYLRIPLLIAAFAFLLGALGNLRPTGLRAFLASALMMVFFLQAARLAMVTFDPYLSSRPLADVLLKSPEGTLITEGHYWPTSSIYFYTNRTGLLLNGRVKNLEYGSNAPGAPDVFINDAKFAALWTGTARCYLVAPQTSLARFAALVGAARLKIVAQSGGKLLVTNLSLPGTV
ncbi:MAG: glycosyltransferase family 39 protein, partial [Chthoniobacterales bacterium]